MTWWKDKKDQVALANELAAKNQSKIILGEIAARVGHDIIGSVRNAEILSKRAQWSNEKQKNLFSESLEKIKSIVGEISQYSKQHDENTGKVEMSMSFDIIEKLTQITKQKQIQYDGQFKIEFTNLIFQKQLVVNVDPLELERSISNLINNAVEASSANSTVTVMLNSDNSYINIEIIDSGKGISEEVLSKIGTKHFTSGKESGTGIGIFYSKQFVESLGGQLKFHSVVDRGTTVNLKIPKTYLMREARDSLNFI